jgi:hypothetical protein
MTQNDRILKLRSLTICLVEIFIHHDDDVVSWGRGIGKSIYNGLGDSSRNTYSLLTIFWYLS